MNTLKLVLRTIALSLAITVPMLPEQASASDEARLRADMAVLFEAYESMVYQGRIRDWLVEPESDARMTKELYSASILNVEPESLPPEASSSARGLHLPPANQFDWMLHVHRSQGHHLERSCPGLGFPGWPMDITDDSTQANVRLVTSQGTEFSLQPKPRGQQYWAAFRYPVMRSLNLFSLSFALSPLRTMLGEFAEIDRVEPLTSSGGRLGYRGAGRDWSFEIETDPRADTLPTSIRIHPSDTSGSHLEFRIRYGVAEHHLVPCVVWRIERRESGIVNFRLLEVFAARRNDLVPDFILPSHGILVDKGGVGSTYRADTWSSAPDSITRFVSLEDDRSAAPAFHVATWGLLLAGALVLILGVGLLRVSRRRLP